MLKFTWKKKDLKGRGIIFCLKLVHTRIKGIAVDEIALIYMTSERILSQVLHIEVINTNLR